MKFPTFHRIGFVFAVLVIVVGCASTAPTRFYNLNSVVSSDTGSMAVSASPDFIIGVGPVTIPDYLNRPNIVIRTSQNQLKFSDFDKWAGSLKSDIARVIAENISLLASTEHVYVFPWRSYVPVKYQVTVNIARFEGVVGGDVSLVASWSIRGGEGKEIILMDTARFIEKTDGRDYDSLIAAESRLLASLSMDIVNALNSVLNNVSDR